jgi:hypothetical protein
MPKLTIEVSAARVAEVVAKEAAKYRAQTDAIDISTPRGEQARENTAKLEPAVSGVCAARVIRGDYSKWYGSTVWTVILQWSDGSEARAYRNMNGAGPQDGSGFTRPSVRVGPTGVFQDRGFLSSTPVTDAARDMLFVCGGVADPLLRQVMKTHGFKRRPKMGRRPAKAAPVLVGGVLVKS